MRQHAARVRADEAAVEAALASRSREQQRTARWAAHRVLSSLLRCKAYHQSFSSLYSNCAGEPKPAYGPERAGSCSEDESEPNQKVCVGVRCREVQRLQQESEELRTLQSHIQAAQVRFTH